ncbi:MAG TPA: hypothetical protein VNU44_12085 [Bryobacteraceae bacterium]|nr:hypothetical protein [Bryobacteraceae bacterium]
MKYHWVKKEIIVKSADEESALGGGWGDLADVAPYRTPRVAPVDQQQLTKWVDRWQVAGLTGEHRRRIEAQLLRADSAFWSAPENASADLAAMQLVFDGVAKVLFDAGILTRKNLQEEISILPWDTAIAGGWYRFASEVAKNIFPERLGHYFVWRDAEKDWSAQFRAERGKWLAELLDKPGSDEAGDQAVGNQGASTELSDASPDQPADNTATLAQPKLAPKLVEGPAGQPNVEAAAVAAVQLRNSLQDKICRTAVSCSCAFFDPGASHESRYRGEDCKGISDSHWIVVWVPHDVRDQIVDFVRRWSEKTGSAPGGSWNGSASGPASSTAGATGTARGTNTTVGFPGIFGWSSGKSRRSSIFI